MEMDLRSPAVQVINSNGITLPVQSIVFSSSKKISCLVSPTNANAGLYNVIVTNPDGQSGRLDNAFTVVQPNRAPVLTDVPATATIPEGVAYTFTAKATDADLPAQTLTFSLVSGPAGAAIGTSDGVFTWTPGFDQAGSYKVTVIVSDGTLTASEDVTITVNNVNRPPVLDPIGPKSINENQLLTFKVSGSDPDGDILTYSTSALPTGATFNSGTKTFSWTPSSGSAGIYSVTFKITDTWGISDEETVKITVNAPTMNVPINIKIIPTTLNLGCKGYFLAFVTLPETYKGATIDIKTVSVSGAPAVRMIRLNIFPRIVVFVFKTSDLMGVGLGKKVSLTVKGELKNNGIKYTFGGSDTVEVISKPSCQPADIKDVSTLSDDQLFKKYTT